MKNKLFSIMSLALFLVLTLSLVSATITLSDATLSRVSGSGSQSITVTSDINQTATFTVVGTNGITGSIVNTNLTNGSNTVTLNYVVPTSYDWTIEETPSIKVTVNAIDSANKTYNFAQTYCVLGNKGNIDLTVEDNEVTNTDSWKWMPLDKISITVNVENNWNNHDMDGTIEFGIWDATENEFVYDDSMDMSVDENEDVDFDIDFTLDASDLNDLDNDYYFYVKAYDEDDGNESAQCEQFSKQLEIISEKDQVLVDIDNIDFPETITAGDTVSFTVEVLNIGTNDQKDLSLGLEIADLAIASKQVIGDIDAAGDSQKVTFSIIVPEDTTTDKYRMVFTIYDDDEEVLEINDREGDEQDATFNAFLNVTGKEFSSALVVAAEDATLKVGEESQVVFKITNLGRKTYVYSLSLDESDWAESAKLNATTISVKPQETKDVVVKLVASEKGSQSLTLNAMVVGKPETSTPYTASVEVQSNSIFSGISLPGSWYLWAVAILNVLLVVAIVVVIVRILRK